MPCPLCGGLIHPVAGRCKHCKEDLSQFRAGRPQAAAALPPLQHSPAAAPAPAPAGNGTSMHAQVVTASNGDVTILPQRITGSQYAAEPRRSLLRNWPLLVIVLACIAIVVAVVIMVMPASASGRRGGKRELMPAPAPERMETNPQNGHDPWGGAPPAPPQAAPQIAPDPDDDSQAQTQPQPRVTPDPPKAPDPRDPDDLFGQLGQGNAGLLFTFAGALCKKMAACPNADQSTIQLACAGLATMPAPPMPTSCPAAQRCEQAIDQLPCDDNAAQAPGNSIMLMQDCVRALTEC